MGALDSGDQFEKYSQSESTLLGPGVNVYCTPVLSPLAVIIKIQRKEQGG